MSRKKTKAPITEAQAEKAAQIASMVGLLSIMPPEKIGTVVQVSKNITARRVPAGIYYQHVLTTPDGTLVHVHAETRTDLEAQENELRTALEALGHNFED